MYEILTLTVFFIVETFRQIIFVSNNDILLPHVFVCTKSNTSSLYYCNLIVILVKNVCCLTYCEEMENCNFKNNNQQ